VLGTFRAKVRDPVAEAHVFAAGGAARVFAETPDAKERKRQRNVP
jgi:hypothetical protein